jgi:hypothetical protein
MRQTVVLLVVVVSMMLAGTTINAQTAPQIKNNQPASTQTPKATGSSIEIYYQPLPDGHQGQRAQLESITAIKAALETYPEHLPSKVLNLNDGQGRLAYEKSVSNSGREKFAAAVFEGKLLIVRVWRMSDGTTFPYGPEPIVTTQGAVGYLKKTKMAPIVNPKTVTKTALYTYRLAVTVGTEAQARTESQILRLKKAQETSEILKINQYNLDLSTDSDRDIYLGFVVARFGEPRERGFSILRGDAIIQWVVYYTDGTQDPSEPRYLKGKVNDVPQAVADYVADVTAANAAQPPINPGNKQ